MHTLDYWRDFGFTLSETRDERVRIGKWDAKHWRIFTQDDDRSWGYTGQPYPTRQALVDDLSRVVSEYYGVAA